MDETVKVLVYGSCVGRDTYEYALSPHLQLAGYVARQSLISAYSPRATLDGVWLERLAHNFQRRVLSDDHEGTLRREIRALALRNTQGIVLWDIVDERLGVYALTEGMRVTRSLELIRSGADAALAGTASHLEFGSDSHFAEWLAALDRFIADLRTAPHILPILLDIPWAEHDVSGSPSPSSYGIPASLGNQRARRYIEAATATGAFEVVTVERPTSDPEHRWGNAPFHYARSVYEQAGTQILGTVSAVREKRAR